MTPRFLLLLATALATFAAMLALFALVLSSVAEASNITPVTDIDNGGGGNLDGYNDTITGKGDLLYYGGATGTCTNAWVGRRRRSLLFTQIYTYYQEIKWCYKDAKITSFWRDRWTSSTFLGWSFDGHVGSNCTYEHCSPGRTGMFSTTVNTQGHYHACAAISWLCKHTYPRISMTVYANGVYTYEATG